MKRFCGIKILLPALCILYVFCAFYPSELSSSTGMLLNKLIETNTDSNLKEQKIEVTPEGFLRLRKKLVSGKEEYFAFHFSRYKEMKYIGTEAKGYADISVTDTNVIVQTFNDPAGNIDSMATGMKINFHQCTAEELSRLMMQFGQLRTEMEK